MSTEDDVKSVYGMSEHEMFCFMAGCYFAKLCDKLTNTINDQFNTGINKHTETGSWMEHVRKELKITKKDEKFICKNKDNLYEVLKFIIKHVGDPLVATNFCDTIEEYKSN
jgi:hypothetical protein